MHRHKHGSNTGEGEGAKSPPKLSEEAGCVTRHFPENFCIFTWPASCEILVKNKSISPNLNENRPLVCQLLGGGAVHPTILFGGQAPPSDTPMMYITP